MSREAWALIKQNKNFNVHVFRRGLFVLIISLGVSCFFGIIMFIIYLSEPENDYYATSGVTSPIKLKSMPAPNESSTPLLEADPVSNDGEKVIPQ